MHTLIAADFHGTPVSILDHLGRRWLTARDVGRCLGYAEDEASRSVIKLYSRHVEEFGAEDTFVVNLTTNSPGNPNVRIFSQTGCILLAMFANTARAKDFRAWAKAALAGFAPVVGEAYAPRPCVRITRHVERQALELFAAGLALGQIARHLGIHKGTASKLVNGQYRFAPDAGTDETTPALIEAVAARHVQEERARIAAHFCASAANQRLVEAMDRAGQRLLAALAMEG